MRSRLVRLVVGALLALFAWPAAALADHVSVTAQVGASVHQIKPTSAKLRVTWSAQCVGAAPGSDNYTGNLYLLRPDLGSEEYLGGVFGVPGQFERTVTRTSKDQVFAPLMRISCFEGSSLHGSESITVSGAAATVPAKERGAGGGGDDGGGGDGDGGDGGDGGGGGGGDPDDPLRGGGCANELRGSNAADALDGEAAGDLILALGGADRVRGRDGHDCLIGGRGGDRLAGEDGYDRLTGGSGGDSLDGGAGRNAYDAGSGDDRVEARNGLRETIRCGSGDDFARVDRNDRVRRCERVRRAG